jgi:lauroyl/myristoyl acyltransferase
MRPPSRLRCQVRGHDKVRLPGFVRDALGLSQMAAGWLLTGLISETSIPTVALWAARLVSRISPQMRRQVTAEMRDALNGLHNTHGPDVLFVTHLRNKYEHLLGRMRDLHKRGWHARFGLQGMEHLEQALAMGKGCILWEMSFCGPVVPKVALWKAGFRVNHLSIPYHGGYSRSWITRRLVNPLTIRGENKYLASRIVIPADGFAGYFRLLTQCLNRNECVSIMGEHWGRQAVTVKVLNRQVQFATGAPHLAHKTGAPLLTLTSYRTGPCQYEVCIQPPVPLDFSTGRSDGFRTAVLEFARRLEDWIRRHPADWERWTAEDLVESLAKKSRAESSV